MNTELLDTIIDSIGIATRKQTETLIDAIQKISPSALLAEEIGKILSCFDESAPHQEVLWSLLHSLERAPLTVFVPGAVVLAIPSLFEKSPDWAETLMCRILNNSAARSIVLNEIQGMETTRRSPIYAILKSIGAEGDSVAKNALEVLRATER